MASPITATRRVRPTSSNSVNRAREISGVMNAKVIDSRHRAQRLPFSGQTLFSLTHSNVAPPHVQATRPPILQRLDDGAKRKVHAIQNYFVLGWNALRFIVARPFYATDL